MHIRYFLKKYGWRFTVNRHIYHFYTLMGLPIIDQKYRKRWFKEYSKRLDYISQNYYADHFIIESLVSKESMTDSDHRCIKYRKNISQQQSLKIIVELLNTLAAYLDKHGIEWFLEGGLLLGSYRNKKIIPWDNDGDIGISNSGLKKLLEVLPYNCFDKKEYVLILRNVHCHDSQRIPSDAIPCIFVDRGSGLYIDFFLHHAIDSKKLRCYITNGYKCRFGSMTLKHEDIYPIAQTILEDNSYCCPNKPIRYLTSWYGNDLSPRKI